MKPSEVQAGMTFTRRPMNGDHRVYRVLRKQGTKVVLKAADVPQREDGFSEMQQFVVPMIDIQKVFRPSKHKGIFFK